jgi:hypothetical protein
MARVAPVTISSAGAWSGPVAAFRTQRRTCSSSRPTATLESLGDGAHLGEDVDAVDVLVHHPLHHCPSASKTPCQVSPGSIWPSSTPAQKALSVARSAASNTTTRRMSFID